MKRNNVTATLPIPIKSDGVTIAEVTGVEGRRDGVWASVVVLDSEAWNRLRRPHLSPRLAPPVGRSGTRP